jgi:hypothetical protein
MSKWKDGNDRSGKAEGRRHRDRGAAVRGDAQDRLARPFRHSLFSGAW